MSRRLPSLFIARRYFLQGSPLKGKKLNFIQWLSGLALLGLSFGTAALIIVMSVFNGLEGLTRQLFKGYNPELNVQSLQGKVMDVSEEQLADLWEIEGIEAISRVLEDQALLRYADRQKVIMIKGVDGHFFDVCALDTCVKVGKPELWNGEYPQALVGAGVQYELSINVRSPFEPLQLWYPRREGKISLSPEKAFKRKSLMPAGAFIIDPEFDGQYVVVPLSFAQELAQRKPDQFSALEIKTDGKTAIKSIKSAISNVLGEGVETLTLEEQQAGILKAIRVERLFVSAALVFIVAIAAFNVFYSLAMMAIEKKRDMSVLRSVGAGRSLVQGIFLFEGAMLGAVGAVSGLLLGGLLCYLQATFGLISLGGGATMMVSYPVAMKPTDFVIAGSITVLVSLLAAIIPARKAASEGRLTL